MADFAKKSEVTIETMVSLLLSGGDGAHCNTHKNHHIYVCACFSELLFAGCTEGSKAPQVVAPPE